MSKFTAVILAAGMGTRMQSDIPKVLHKVCGKEMASWVLDAAKKAGADKTAVVVGYKAESVEKALGGSADFIVQKEQKGTGHAVMQAEKYIENSGTVVILNADTPLITFETIKKCIRYHEDSKNDATAITAVLEDASGYARVVRDLTGNVIKIVSDKDAGDYEKEIKEINSGMYVFNSKALCSALEKLAPKGAPGEYHLSNTLEILLGEGKKIGAFVIEDNDEIRGINDRIQLAGAEKIMQMRINREHMKNGVTFILPETTIIESGAEIGRDTVIYPGAIIKSGTKIGRNCSIGMNTQIDNSVLEDNVNVLSSVIIDSQIGEGTTVGPFAYLRPNSRIGKGVRVGDFVEIKNSNVDDGTKISHLTYVGDSDVGKRVNFGCGTVTVNYDGKKKYRTKIGDDCFIGCNTNLVAPVTVENGGYTAAGSTITDAVPENSLAIARARQVIKKEWKDRRK